MVQFFFCHIDGLVQIWPSDPIRNLRPWLLPTCVMFRTVTCHAEQDLVIKPAVHLTGYWWLLWQFRQSIRYKWLYNLPEPAWICMMRVPQVWSHPQDPPWKPNRPPLYWWNCGPFPWPERNLAPWTKADVEGTCQQETWSNLHGDVGWHRKNAYHGMHVLRNEHFSTLFVGVIHLVLLPALLKGW